MGVSERALCTGNVLPIHQDAHLMIVSAYFTFAPQPDSEQIGQSVVVGQTGWETVLKNNKQTFASQFLQRSRFTTALPTTMTPAQFVDKLNQNAGGVLSMTDRTMLINLFGNATDTSNPTPRAQALRQVAENQNLSNSEFNRAFVLMEFFGYLRRDPNSGQDSDYTAMISG